MVGWAKGEIGNQYYFRGTLTCGTELPRRRRAAELLGLENVDGVVDNLFGEGSVTGTELLVYRLGEMLRLLLYSSPIVLTIRLLGLSGIPPWALDALLALVGLWFARYLIRLVVWLLRLVTR